MRALLILGLVSVTGTTGCEEAKGTPPPGCGNPGQVVWVDAAGTCVPGVVATSELYFDEKNFFDAAGHIWTVNVQSGEVSPCYHRELWFQSPDCTGTAYVSPTPPRVTFLAGNDPTIRVLPDDVQRTIVETYYQLGNECTEIGSATLASIVKVPAEVTAPDTPIEMPSLSYQFPLHPVLVK